MKKFVQSTDPVVKSAMDDEEVVAKASLCEEQDISNLIAKGEKDDEAEDQMQRELPRVLIVVNAATDEPLENVLATEISLSPFARLRLPLS